MIGIIAVGLALLSRVQPPDLPPLITAGVTDTPPRIDGRMDDPCWAVAAVAAPFVLLATAELPTQRTVTRICGDAEAIYVGFWCWEDLPDHISARAQKNDSGEAWKDDCVEVFLAPDGIGRVYYHLIVTAGGMVDDEMCWRFGAERSLTWNAYAQTAVRRFENGWTCEIAFPLRYLGGASLTGRWLANFARAEQPHGEYSSWSALITGFHEPKRFGHLVWEKQAAVANLEMSPLSVGPAWVRFGWARLEPDLVVRVRQLTPLAEYPVGLSAEADRWQFTLVPRTDSFLRIETFSGQPPGGRLLFATAPIAYSLAPVTDKLAQLNSWVQEAAVIAGQGRGVIA
ncbi:MAG: carbohydrate-binding family 9-like protein, partial [Armatimonadetes bacterium]|nr:carbohydrate-binding family 9-like protein [Armatimonadota bacterium]